MFFKKKPANMTSEDRQLIARNAKAVDAIMVYAADDDKPPLDSLKEKLKYLVPSDNGEVRAWDKKIAALLDDFRIGVSTERARSGKSAAEYITDITAAIAERNLRL